MAIRRITAADIPTLRTRWDAHRAIGGEYPGEGALDVAWLARVIADPEHIVLIDPVSKTLTICLVAGNACQIDLMLTATTGAIAIVRAMDHMFEAVAQGCIARTIPLIWGEYTFAAGVDTTQTRAVRYFSSMTPPGVKTVTAHADGTTTVRFEGASASLLAALLARTP